MSTPCANDNPPAYTLVRGSGETVNLSLTSTIRPKSNAVQHRVECRGRKLTRPKRPSSAIPLSVLRPRLGTAAVDNHKSLDASILQDFQSDLPNARASDRSPVSICTSTTPLFQGLNSSDTDAINKPDAVKTRAEQTSPSTIEQQATLKEQLNATGQHQPARQAGGWKPLQRGAEHIADLERLRLAQLPVVDLDLERQLENSKKKKQGGSSAIKVVLWIIFGTIMFALCCALPMVITMLLEAKLLPKQQGDKSRLVVQQP